AWAWTKWSATSTTPAFLRQVSLIQITPWSLRVSHLDGALDTPFPILARLEPRVGEHADLPRISTSLSRQTPTPIAIPLALPIAPRNGFGINWAGLMEPR